MPAPRDHTRMRPVIPMFPDWPGEAMLPAEVSMPNALGQRIKRLRGEERRAAISDVVSRWRESGASQVAFCRAEGVSRATLRRWNEELGVGPPTQRGSVLVEVGRHEGPVARDGFDVTLGARPRSGLGRTLPEPLMCAGPCERPVESPYGCRAAAIDDSIP